MPERGTAKAPADRASARLFAFAAGLVVALVAGFGLGRVIGPVGTSTDSGANAMNGMAGMTGSAQPSAGHTHGTTVTAGDQVGGLAIAAGGYTLVPESTALRAGGPQPFRFRIDGPDRKPVTTFAIAHDKPMHVIVVRRDLSGYQHLHPTMAADGTWIVQLGLPDTGPWRVFADFVVAGPAGVQTAATLGVDLTVAGQYQPHPLPAAARESTVDYYTVTYEGTPQVGATQPLLFRIFSSGRPVLGLDRYLGAYGHLVVLREGDLGYVHVHPEDQLVGGAVKFWLAAPSPGRYRMFFDFQVNGQVHTAQYTMVVS
ncbi:MAG TPA: hypothetical protein VFE14_10125 [Micromonosporaceae bacterium]|jgi:hypothetical protein|nr:hypothetical protein [Micromonosporaceae bacterium]